MDAKMEEVMRIDFRKTKVLFGESMYLPREEDHIRFWRDFEDLKKRERQSALDRAAGAFVT